MSAPYRLTVNGVERAVEDAWLGESLLHVRNWSRQAWKSCLTCWRL